MENWKSIKTEKDFYAIVEKSHKRPQIIFKDSMSCGISAFAKERLIKGNEILVEKADFNYLDLLNNRSISNLIADKLGVIHQSPQILVLKEGKVTYNVSHHSINPEKIVEYL